ncbi:hypothetical protein CHARACLAT_019663, partial [Characodon lateralis]|nr:hypothetical protein [Characodon lateralis]
MLQLQGSQTRVSRWTSLVFLFQSLFVFLSPFVGSLLQSFFVGSRLQRFFVDSSPHSFSVGSLRSSSNLQARFSSALVSRENPEQLIIALEPEAASIYCRKLRLHQMVDLGTQTHQNGFTPNDQVGSGMTQAKEHVRRNRQSRTFLVENVIGELWSELEE